jgi:hypothetical protein
MIAGFTQAARKFRRAITTFHKWTKGLIQPRDFAQGEFLVALGELIIKLGSSRRQDALTNYRFPLSAFRF